MSVLIETHTNIINCLNGQNGKAYNFLNDSRLKNRLIFLGFSGSHAYGTNVESSDVDLRGVFLEQPRNIIGFEKIEQIEDKNTDSTIYSFNKFIKLLTDMNPNIIELLGLPEYVFMNDLWHKLVENKNIFLSQKAYFTFNGFIISQMMRLENNLARFKIKQNLKERHILDSVKKSMLEFEKRYNSDINFKLYISKSNKADYESEIYCDITAQNYPLRDFRSLISDMLNVVKDYDKISKGNPKDDLHLNKHAMHTIRLYCMGIDLLERGEIITKRDKEHELLMNIRNGFYQREDGSYKDEYFDIVNEYRKRLEYAKEHTVLPEKPDLKRIEEFVMRVNESIVRSEI